MSSSAQSGDPVLLTSTSRPTPGGSGRQSLLWVFTSLASVVVFVSWFWLGLVEEGARQDEGRAGQEYADALVNDRTGSGAPVTPRSVCGVRPPEPIRRPG